MKIEITAEVYEKYLRDGCPEEIVKRMTPLVRMIVGSWCRRFPQNAKDLHGVAWLAHMQALRRAPSKDKITHKNIVGYLKLSIEGQILKHIKSDHVIRIPLYLQDKGRKESEEYALPETLSTDTLEWVEQPSKPESNGLFEYYEYCLNRMALSHIESKILAYAREGYNNTEIADKMLVSHTLVNRHKAELARRFNLLRHNPKLKKRFFGDGN